MATIQGVYVALFGRPADPNGLAFFNGVTKNGADLNGIGDLASTQEYKDRFANQNNTQIVNSIYQSLFGRDAEATGLNFFVDALNKGTLNIKNIAIAILDGAQGNDKTIVTNKVAAADLYTKSLDTAAEIGSYSGNAAAAQGRAFIAGVTTTVPNQAAVDASITSMQAAGAVGNTIVLQGAAEELSLTKGIVNNNVTLFTTNNNDTVTGGANFAANDKIDGGLGVDTLTATLGAGATALGDDTLKNVEIVRITSSADNAQLTNVNKATGLQQLWSDAGTPNSFEATGISLSTTVGVKGAFAAKTNTFAFDSVDSGSTVKLALDAATGTGAISIATAGTIELSNANTSSVALTVAAKAINVSGAGSLTAAITDATLETVNASTFTGNLTANLSANDALKTVTGGTGIDTITIDTKHTNDITIATGAGADTITVKGIQNVASAADAGDGNKEKVTAATFVGATKAVVLTGGDGADTFQFGGTGKNFAVGDAKAAAGAADTVTEGSVANVLAIDTAANLVKSLITVSDFAKASDAIKVSDGVTTGGGRQTILDADLATISGQADLLAAAKKAAEFTALDKVAAFNFGSDAYILVNSGTTAFEAGDTLIKVTGVAVADLTATNFVVV